MVGSGGGAAARRVMRRGMLAMNNWVADLSKGVNIVLSLDLQKCAVKMWRGVTDVLVHGRSKYTK